MFFVPVLMMPTVIVLIMRGNRDAQGHTCFSHYARTHALVLKMLIIVTLVSTIISVPLTTGRVAWAASCA